MERWVDSDAIQLAGYAPRLLGKSDDAAVQGLLARMEELIVFSQERGAKLKLMIDPRSQPRNRPESLECALETARVSADILHPLGERLRVPLSGGVTLKGWVLQATGGGPPEHPPHVATRIVLLDTDWSTGTDAGGYYEFRNLPPGTYRVGGLRPGGTAKITLVTLPRSGVRIHDMSLVPIPPWRS